MIDITKYVILLPIFAMIIVGCEGDPGSPGQNRLPEDRYPPTVEIILPLAGKPLYDQSVVELSMFDDDTIARREFLVDGVESNASFSVRRAPSLFSWDASTLLPGRHTLQMKVTDATGKVGESSLLYLLRSDSQPTGLQELRYFADSTGVESTKWKLPADSTGSFAGLGTRFTPDKPCLLRSVSVKLYRKASWRDTRLFLDIYTERNALPDSLLYRKVIALRGDGVGDINDFAVSTFRNGLPIHGEFFAVVTLADDAVRDTLAIQSDDGGWANGHGMMKTLSGEWRTFDVGRGRKPNPLIFALVEY